MRILSFLVVFCWHSSANSQQIATISGIISDSRTSRPLYNAQISFEGLSIQTNSDEAGKFLLSMPSKGEYVLAVVATDYLKKRIPIVVENVSIDLGTVFLEKDVSSEKTDNLITLTDGDLSDDEETFAISSGLLQSSRDIFLRRAAFDFGQAFFKVKGYDSRNGKVTINGLEMNKFFDGRAQWNNWGGLNDVLRNQQFTPGLSMNTFSFGGILGNTNMDTRPSGLRPGFRLSSSFSNRSYRGRAMVTYNSGMGEKGLAYTISSSRRWANEGFLEGTLYDAYSFFGSLEYKANEENTFLLTAILAKNRRGRSAAVTEEVYELVGNRYNPYWGLQNGKLRNSRERDIFEPIFLFNYFLETDKTRWTTGIAYQFGVNARSRLGYYDAANPDPTYYRYLPSHYINNPSGADFTNASLAREGFLENPQIQWEQLYQANRNAELGGRAAYLLHDDVASDKQLTLSSSFEYLVSPNISLGLGAHAKNLNSENYAQIKDLLGAEFHQDIDFFSNTANDVLVDERKTIGNRFGYNYQIKASEIKGFAQASINFNKLSAFTAISLENSSFQRIGLFQNERFPETSLGESEKISFSTMGLKGGASYFLSGRHWIAINAAQIGRPPTLQNLFVNPRENNDLVPEILPETITSITGTYNVRLTDLVARLTLFYTRFMDTTDINFFFVDSGLGSDFVQEVITQMDKLHKGVEVGLEYELSTQVKVSLVGNFGNYTFASDPEVQINFDPSGSEEESIAPSGNVQLGVANIKNLRLSQGPQTALALGIEYRDPKYWWVGASANYLGDNHLGISTITRTQSFLLDPDTGEQFAEATDESVNRLLEQKKLEDIYLLNITGGKSWFLGKKYISAFLSVNNLFDSVFRTGGYEQSRNGNFGQLQQETLSGQPSFGPKYWSGFGRTYFLNLAISF
nr:TonB-dependent receptor [Allomuricauda sp.]